MNREELELLIEVVNSEVGRAERRLSLLKVLLNLLYDQRDAARPKGAV